MELSLQQAPQVQQQGNRCQSKVHTIRCASNESKNRKVHCQERRSPAHPTQTRIVALSSAIPVQKQQQSHRKCSRHRRCNNRANRCRRCTVADVEGARLGAQKFSSSTMPLRAFYEYTHSPRDPSGTHWTALPQRPGGNGKCKRQRKLEQCCKSVEYTCSEKGTASWDRAASQRDCKLGQSCKSENRKDGSRSNQQ